LVGEAGILAAAPRTRSRAARSTVQATSGRLQLIRDPPCA